MLKDNSKMPFGKHSGKLMEDVPDEYLMWLWNKNESKFKSKCIHYQPLKYVMQYIKDNLDAIENNLN